MIEKIDKIQELLNLPNVDASAETAINNMKILNLIVDLRADVSGCFSLARYINGYYVYSDNAEDGDIYMNVVTRKYMTETEIVKEWVRLNNR